MLTKIALFIYTKKGDFKIKKELFFDNSIWPHLLLGESSRVIDQGFPFAHLGEVTLRDVTLLCKEMSLKETVKKL